jgi:phospholipase/carboxylesterase
VWLHGLGADGHDFAPIVPHLEMPWVRFVFPHAPQRPVTINGGMQMRAWYDVRGLGPGGADASHVAESRRQVENLLAHETARGLPTERILLAGFSQGGAVAMHSALRHGHRLAGVLVLSAYDLLAEGLESEAAEENRDTPLLFCHGTHDPLVPVDRGRAAYEARCAEGRTAEWHEFPMGHEVCLPEIQLVARWLRQRLPPE